MGYKCSHNASSIKDMALGTLQALPLIDAKNDLISFKTIFPLIQTFTFRKKKVTSNSHVPFNELRAFRKY